MTETHIKNDPLFSVIVVNYNYGRFLENAIQSIINQSFTDFELILVDGGSNDNSLDIIKKYQERIAWWCSEKDRGQSHAYNKGFKHAKGQILTWLNSDDIMMPETLFKIHRKASTNKNKDNIWITGGCIWYTSDLKVIKLTRARRFSNILLAWNQVSVWGPSSFFSKALLEEAGWVDERFHYMMDTELWLRFAKKTKVRYKIVNGYCWGLRLHADAKMSGHNFIESPLAHKDHLSWNQKIKEQKILNEIYGSKKVPFILRFFPLFSPYFYLSYLDTLFNKFKMSGNF